MVTRAEIKRRLAAARPKGQGPRLCDCGPALADYAAARWPGEEGNELICRHCGRPIMPPMLWPDFLADCRRAYGE